MGGHNPSVKPRFKYRNWALFTIALRRSDLFFSGVFAGSTTEDAGVSVWEFLDPAAERPAGF